MLVANARFANARGKCSNASFQMLVLANAPPPPPRGRLWLTPAKCIRNTIQ